MAPDVYTATTVLIAARICPPLLGEISEAAVSRSWDKAIAVLEALRMQSSSARRCLVTLEVLNEKITLQHPAYAAQPTTSNATSTQSRATATFHQDVSDDVNDTVPLEDINLTDMGWLNSVPFDLDAQFYS